LAICTRPDISYAAMSLGQFNANPSRAHLVAAKRVLRYIAGTVDLALEFNFDGVSYRLPLVVLSVTAPSLMLIGLRTSLTARVFQGIVSIS